MTEKPGVWRDATTMDIGGYFKVRIRNEGQSSWQEFDKSQLWPPESGYRWRIVPVEGLRKGDHLYSSECQVFDETPAAEPEWQEPTVEMVGREVLAQFRNFDNDNWSGTVRGCLHHNKVPKCWSAPGQRWFNQCRVKPLDTKAEEPKVEAGKAATDDGWRDAVWPDDWGMACRKGNQGPAIGYLIGYDPTDFETPWVYGVKTPYDPEEAAVGTCQVNDRLARFVMPGGGK